MPIALDAYSEPEPDVAVVPGTARDYRDAHPSAALLIVEVSDVTLDLDCQRKSVLYARNGIREFWTVNLIDRCVEVFREPEGNTYRSRRKFGPGESVAPLSAPDAAVPVAGLLP